MHSWITAGTLFTTLFLLSSPALAETRAEEDPRVRLEAAYETIATITAQVETQEQLVSQLTAKMTEILDSEAFAARTLKGRWKKLSQSQRKKFTKHFKALILKTYSKRFKPRARFEVEYRGDTRWLDEARTLGEVHTTVKGTRAAADVSYLFTRGSQGKVWRIVDITIDEVSMAQNWRRQFVRIIDKEGFSSLISRIRSKTEASSTGR